MNDELLDDIFSQIAKDKENAAEKRSLQKAAEQTKTYHVGGKGRKQCKHCQAFVGVRTQVCVCGEAFKKRTKKSAANRDYGEDPELQPALAFGHAMACWCASVCWTPEGKCPVKYKGDIEEWVRDVMHHRYSTHAQILSPRALRYWLRKFFDDPASPKLAKALKKLNEFVESVLGVDF